MHPWAKPDNWSGVRAYPFLIDSDTRAITYGRYQQRPTADGDAKRGASR